MKKRLPKSTAGTAPVTTFARPAIARLVSIAIAIHLTAMALSFTATVEPSSFHRKLLSLLAPYQHTLHLDANQNTFYLAHGGTDEQPHRIQWTDSLDPSGDDWKPLVPETTAGLAASDRMARFLAAAAQWSDEERSSEVAALVRPFVLKEPNAIFVRIVRLPTELTTVVDDAAPPPYVARVIRSPGSVDLVQIKPARFVTTPSVSGPSVSGPALSERPAK